MATSCGHDHDHDHELDLATDPTLASCCERDQQNFDKAMKLKALLTAHDPTSNNVKMRQQLFQPPVSTVPATQAPIPQQKATTQDDAELDSDFDDSDDEFGMEAMLLARRQQLEQAAKHAADGYTVVLDASLSSLLQQLQTQPEVPRVVLAVTAQEDTDFVRAMRSEMTAVAQRFAGSKFYVVQAGGGDDALRQLRLPSVPCLAAFRRGERVDLVVLDATTLAPELELLWEARFLPWLTNCNVLATERQDHNSRNSASERSKQQAAGDREEPSGYDCGVEGCRLRFGYEHEHVGTSQATKDEIAAWRQSPS